MKQKKAEPIRIFVHCNKFKLRWWKYMYSKNKEKDRDQLKKLD